jgi:hypothetical protein
MGACCGGTSCTLTLAADCAGAGERFAGAGVGCGTANTATNCCPADFNFSGESTVQDLFDFLAAFYANDPRADINVSGNVSVQDIFDFLGHYFGGC